MTALGDMLAWSERHVPLAVLLALVVPAAGFALASALLGRGDRTLTRLSRRLWLARLVRPGRCVTELHAFALSRARGSGGWSVELVFDGPARERVPLGRGELCEQEQADAIVAWAQHQAAALRARAEIVSGSNC